MSKNQGRNNIQVQISREADRIIRKAKKDGDKSKNTGVAAALLGVAAQLEEPSRARKLLAKIKELL